MPDVVVAAVREHHNEGYQGPESQYANLILVVDHLLSSLGEGDSIPVGAPAAIRLALGLDEATTATAVAELKAQAPCLDELAGALAA